MQYPFWVWEFEVHDYQISHLDCHFIVSSQHLENRFQKLQRKQIKDSLLKTKSAVGQIWYIFHELVHKKHEVSAWGDF